MKKLLTFLAVMITMAACSSAPPASPMVSQQPTTIIYYRTPNTPLPTTPVGTYWIPVPAGKVYQNPAYPRGY
jgi:hypothetical protein